MKARAFVDHLRTSYLVALCQKAVRTLLRALWLGGAAYLLLWASALALEFDIHTTTLIICGIAVGVLVLVLSWVPYPIITQFTWRLDRELGFDEQISTALMASRSSMKGPVIDGLMDDAVRILANHEKKQIRRGWGLLPELLAIFAIAILIAGIHASQSLRISSIIPPNQVELLPPIAQEPSLEEIFPSGMPALDLVARKADSPGSSEADPVSAEDLARLVAVMEDMGRQLADHGEDRGLAVELQQGDLQGVADALAGLNAEGLTTQGRLELSEALGTGGENLDVPRFEDLAGALLDASGALKEDRDDDADRAMGEASSAFRDVAEQIQLGIENTSQDGGQPGSEVGLEGSSGGGSSEVGPGGRTSGEEEPAARLQGESNDKIEFQSSGTDLGAVTAGDSNEDDGDTTTGGFFNYYGQQGDSIVESILMPYRYSWSLRDVIARFFARQ